MPLKIRPTATPYPGDNPAGGGSIQGRNEASVDSELSTLGLRTKQISGAITNPYFQGFRPIAEVDAAPLLLVTRLDAPESATVTTNDYGRDRGRKKWLMGTRIRGRFP